MKNHPFYFGNSVSSMQTEGGWDQGGKSLSIYDIKEATADASDWHVANDNYNHYVEDFDWMKEAGMNMYRFQISWSRVVKDGDGAFNEEGIAYYDTFIDELLSRGIEPMICLYHFDMPLKLAQQYNGFSSKHVVDAFIRFGKEMVNRFSHKVTYWLTFNEQNIFHNHGSFIIAGSAAAETTENLYQIAHNVMVCHTTLTNYIHQTTEALVGGMLAYNQAYPATPQPKDVEAQRKWDEFTHFHLMDCFFRDGYSKEVQAFLKKNHLVLETTEQEMAEIRACKNDFIALSYYSSTTIDASKIPEQTPPNFYFKYAMKKNPYLAATQWSWQIDPIGFRDALNRLYQRYQVPVFPIENGIGVKESWDGEHPIEDDYRIAYHQQHLEQLFLAKEEDGVEILGYLGWGLIDILSSQGDMRKRYGVIYVNRENHDLKDMKRVPKKSYYWLKNYIETYRRSENE